MFEQAPHERAAWLGAWRCWSVTHLCWEAGLGTLSALSESAEMGAQFPPLTLRTPVILLANIHGTAALCLALSGLPGCICGKTEELLAPRGMGWVWGAQDPVSLFRPTEL